MINLLTPPICDDEDKTLVAHHLFIIIWTFMVVGWLALLIAIIIPETAYRWLLVIGVIELAGLSLLALNKCGRTRLVSNLLLFSTWAVATGMALTGGGTSSNAMAIYLIVVLIAGLVLSGRAGMITAALCSLTGLFLVYLEYSGALPVNRVSHNALTLWIANTLYMAIIISLQYLVSRTIKSALKQSRRELKERKRLDAALRESEEKYRLIAENTADLISILDMNLRSTYVSPASMSLRGFTVEEAMEQTLDQILTPESMRLGLTVFENEMQLEASGTADPDRTRMLELEEYKKDGSVMWVEVSLSFLRDKDRKPVGILIVSRDITERKRAEAVMRESEKRFRELAELLPETVFETDIQGTLTFMNRIAFDLFGYTQEGFSSGLNVLNMVTPDDRNRALENVRRIANGKHVGPSEFTMLRKDGSTFPSTIHSTAIIHDGTPSGIRGFIVDISDRKRGEERIKASLLEKETLLQEIHHRVKNNLNIISSLLNMQSSTLQDKGAIEALQASITRVQTMANIHTQLYQSHDLAKIDFDQFIHDLISNISQSYGRTESPVKIDVDAEEISLGIDNSIPCGLILNELIANALKYAFPGGREGEINIAMRQQEKAVTLTVQDNGIGLPETIDLKNLKSLGLELVSILVAQMNGKLDMRVDGGTIWTITFPLKEEREWHNG